MDIKLINIGFGNIVAANRIISIISPESAPIKRIIQEARDKGLLVDATYGRRTRAVVVTDSGHIILSAVQPVLSHFPAVFPYLLAPRSLELPDLRGTPTDFCGSSFPADNKYTLHTVYYNKVLHFQTGLPLLHQPQDKCLFPV